MPRSPGEGQHYRTRNDLTPRQQQVLALLVKGHTNRQVADELGISLDGAKWHVSEILSTLALDTREEAAEWWRQQNGFRARIRDLAHAFAAPGVLRWATIGGGAAAGVAAVAVTAIVILDRDDAAAPDQDATPPPAELTPVATPDEGAGQGAEPLEEFAGLEVEPLSAGDPVDVPQDWVLYFNESARPHGSVNIHRAYRAASGDLITESVLGFADRYDQGYVASAAIGQGGALMAAVFCLEPRSQCGPFGEPQPGAESILLTSGDGGVSWTEQREVQAGTYIHTVDEQGILLVSHDEGDRTYWYAETGEPVDPPAEGEAHPASNTSAFWRITHDTETHQYVRTDGIALDLPDEPAVRLALLARSDDGELFFSGAPVEPDVHRPWLLVATGQEGDASAAYQWEGGRISVAQDLGNGLLLGNADFPSDDDESAGQPAFLPVLIDRAAHTVHVINELPREHTQIQPWHLTIGKPLRVQTGGSCLNVRESPSTGADPLDCFSDGVLLFERDDDDPRNGWLPVRAPDGRGGWAADEFLVR